MNRRATQSEVESALRLVVEGTAAETGADFFRTLVRNLAQALETTGAWVTEYLPEIRDIGVAIRGTGLHPVLVPEGRELGTRSVGGYTELTVPSLEVMQSIHVPGYFVQRLS